MTITRDEIIAIIEDSVEVSDGYDLDMETGDEILVDRVYGIDKAADAIIARLEQEQKAKDYNPEAILRILGITR